MKTQRSVYENNTCVYWTGIFGKY